MGDPDRSISVLARIAVRAQRRMIPDARSSHPACGVAVATLAALTVGLLQVLEVLHSEQEDWIPLAIYPFLALAILSPAVVGLLIALQLPRNRIAWILLLGALPARPRDRAEQIVGAAGRIQTERRPSRRCSSPGRSRRVRLPGRPAPVAPLALGRRRGDRELRGSRSD